MKNFLEKIAYISRINLPKNEEIKMEEQINELINYSKMIMNFSESYTQEFYEKKIFNVFREDLVKSSSGKEEIIKNSPNSIENFFVVPDLIKRK